MICVGIDVAKDKHDCIILNSEGKILAGAFTFPNNAEGFDTLLHKIHSCANSNDKIKVGLEAKCSILCKFCFFGFEDTDNSTLKCFSILVNLLT